MDEVCLPRRLREFLPQDTKIWALKLWAAKAQCKVSKEMVSRCSWCNTATALPPGFISSLAVTVLPQEAGTMRTHHHHHGKTPVM